MSKFILTDLHVIAKDEISFIDFSNIEELKIHGVLKNGLNFTATNSYAIELIMQVKPSALEGKRMKWAKHAWAFHNLIGHPFMQLLALFGFYDLAIKVHDKTIPRPKEKK